MGRKNVRMSLIIDNPEDEQLFSHNSSNNGVLTNVTPNLGGCNAQSLITLQNQVLNMTDFMKQAAAAPCKMQLVWGNSEGLLMLQLRNKHKKRQQQAQDGTTKVDPSWFQEGPLKRLGVSGGTAPFFHLHLTPAGMQEASQRFGGGITSTSYFIGKDLSHAEDEREFYEQVLRIRDQGTEQNGVALLMPFLFDYMGVLHDPCDNRQLLVLQNLRHDYKSFRMLDLKMGCQTAQGGWQGKPRLNAWRQNLLDGMTNSAQEGYRLEGFDGCERRLQTNDLLMDVLVKAYKSRTAFLGRAMTNAEIKRATRVLMQSLTGADIFRYFMDLHFEQIKCNTKVEETYLSVEVQEIVLNELVSQLVALAVACHKVRVPQKWIGSSVALGYDAGLFPQRDDLLDEAEDSIRQKVVVKVFDWGRSELLTQQAYEAMSSEKQTDRQRFWDNYIHGVDNLAYNATRSYYHHFTNAHQWTELTLQIVDFDASSEIGHVTIPLGAPPSAKSQIVQAGHLQLENYAETSCGTLRCSVSWLELPNDSRLRGTWRVSIVQAINLPSVGKHLPDSLPLEFKASRLDTFCCVTARCANGRELEQRTKVVGPSLNPEWNETIDVPVMRQGCLLEQVLRDQGLAVPQEGKLGELFPLGEPDIAEWSKILQEAANQQ